MTETNSNKPDKKRIYILLILDDVVSDNNFYQSPSLIKLFVRGRRICIAIILIFRYLHLIPPVARNGLYFLCRPNE